MGSPCIDVCRYDEETGWCFGCGMRKAEKKLWKKEREARPAIRDALPPRLAALQAAGHPTGKDAKHRRKEKDKKAKERN